MINDVFDNRSLLITYDPENKVIRIFDREVDGKFLTFETIDGIRVDSETQSVWSFSGEALSGTHSGKSLERLDTGPHFWFAWAAFNTDSDLYNE